MLLNPLSQDMPVEFVVSITGSVAIVHKGRAQHDYIWVQYDQYADSVQLVTEDGKLQDLGLSLNDSMLRSLMKTREVMMIELTDNMAIRKPKLLKFSALVH